MLMMWRQSQVSRAFCGTCLGLFLGAVLFAGCAGPEPQNDDAVTAAEPQRAARQAFGANPAAAGGVAPEVGPTAAGAEESSTSPRRYTDLRRHTHSLVGSDFHVDVSPYGDRVYFSSTRHSRWANIYAKSVDGKAVRQITNTGVNDINPRVSPRGDLLAFASDRNGNYDIFITTARIAGAVWQVTSSPGPEIAPSWSPDGRKIVYSAKNDYGVWEIWIKDLETQALTNLGPGLFPAWSPLGNRIVFQRGRGRAPNYSAIWTIGVDGNDPTEIVSSDEWAAERPSWSPDGSWIVFTSVGKSPGSHDDGGSWRSPLRMQMGDDVWVVRANGSALTQVTSWPQADFDAVWGLDGRIYFSLQRDRGVNVWSLRPVLLDVSGVHRG